MPRFLTALPLSTQLLAAGLTVAALLPGVAQADATLDKIKQRGKVSIGVLVNGSAFGSIDPSNQQLVGWNPELARALAKGLGWMWTWCRCRPPPGCSF